MEILAAIWNTTLGTVKDVLPIAAIIFGFQFAVLRQKPANLGEILFGFFSLDSGCCHLHDYGKAPRPGRKLGHVTVVSEERDERDQILEKLANQLNS